MIKGKHIIIAVTLLVISGCRDAKKEPTPPAEKFALYVARDTFLMEENASRVIPHIDRIIEIDSKKTTLEKIKTIADSLSTCYFNGLKIEVMNLPQGQTNELIVGINLEERDEFTGPGSLPSYQSWYDYFQGSAGGSNTTIVLRESLLQREFKGPWIDGVLFFYQGDTIDEWDHIDLHGLKKR